MQSLLRSRALAEPLVKNSISCQSGRLQSPSFFASSPAALRSHSITSKRPRPSTIEHSKIVEALKQPFATYGGWGHRFQSTKWAVNILVGMNTAVFAAWLYADHYKNSRLQQFLMNNTTLSWFNIKANRYWTAITSAFSHQSLTHIVFNMMSFNAFTGTLIYAGNIGIGAPHLIGLYLGSAIAGSTAYLYMKQPTVDRRFGPYAQHLPSTLSYGLGASGAVMGVAAAATCIAPFTPMSLVLIPIPFPAYIFTIGYFAADLFLLGANDRIGHDAHLGGAVFGLAYYLVALRGYGGLSHIVRRLVTRR